MENRIGFAHSGRVTPYMRKVFGYAIDGSEGTVEFDGHYYVSEPDSPRKGRSLPKIEFLLVKKEGEERESDMYVVEVYRQEKLECTDVISTIDDDEGGEMSVCFFPTDHQRLYFRVLEKNPTHERYLEIRRNNAVA
jgi:hypothetical protein